MCVPGPLLQVLRFVQQAGLCWCVCFCILLSHKPNEFRPSLSRRFFSFSSTSLWNHLYRYCDRATNVSDLYERAASCTRTVEANSIEEAPISRTFVRIVFSLVCSTSSYPIELVTELSCLLFDISACTIVLPQHIYCMSAFSTVGVVLWPGLLYLEL